MNILVAGDFCPQHRVARLFDEGRFGVSGFADVLGEVKPIVEQADYAIVNFECPVCGTEEQPIAKCGPNLKCSEKGIEAVKWVGFDCVTLANNHFRDYGDAGCNHTLAACKSFGIETIGGGNTLKEASATLYKNIGGKMLAIINCCEHEFSIAQEKRAGSNPLNPVQQYYAIKEAKTKAEYVLVIVHGGHEHYPLPSTRMQETYRFFVDAGADAVVNHHQHCFSGYEVYKDKPIVYGLGNFCFDKAGTRPGGWTEGYMVQLDFTGSAPSFQLVPYRQCADEPKVELLPTDSIKKSVDELCRTIADEGLLRSSQEEYYGRGQHIALRMFEPFSSRLYLALKNRHLLPSFFSRQQQLKILNHVDCESHRDKLIYALSNNSK